MSAAEYRAGKPKTKPRKFRNEPIVVDGRRYASKREAAYCEELIQLEKAGRSAVSIAEAVSAPGAHREVICVYVADAAFFDHEQGRLRVIDVKARQKPRPSTQAQDDARALKGIEVEVVW